MELKNKLWAEWLEKIAWHGRMNKYCKYLTCKIVAFFVLFGSHLPNLTTSTRQKNSMNFSNHPRHAGITFEAQNWPERQKRLFPCNPAYLENFLIFVFRIARIVAYQACSTKSASMSTSACSIYINTHSGAHATSQIPTLLSRSWLEQRLILFLQLTCCWEFVEMNLCFAYCSNGANISIDI
jgi:hypothetical protein